MSGWRSDVRDTFMVSLTAFMAANPTLVDQIYKSCPPSLADRRVIFIGGITEEITQDPGVRRRACEVTLVCTAQLGDSTEVTDDLEVMADALVDYLTANYGLTGALTYQEPVRTTTTELNESGTYIPAIAVVARAYIQQGRT